MYYIKCKAIFLRILIIILYILCHSYVYANSCDSLIRHFNLLSAYQKSDEKDTLQSYSNHIKICYEQKDSLASLIKTYKIRAIYEHENKEDKIKVLDTLTKLPIFKKPKNKNDTIAVLGLYVSLAKYQIKVSQYALARKNYEIALGKYEAYGINNKEYNIAEYCLKPLANIYTRYGDNDKSKNLINQAINLAKSINDRPYRIAGHYDNLGTCYWNEGNNEKAIELYNMGLAIENVSNKIRAHLFLSKAESQFELYLKNKTIPENKEITLFETNNLLDKAIANSQKAAKLCDDAIFIAELNNLLAIIAKEQGEIQLANKYALKTLVLTKKTYTQNAREVGKAYNTIGQVKIAAQQYKEAIHNFDSALATVLPNFKPNNIFDLPSANEFYKENTIFEALNGKADALQKFYEIEKEEQLLETALSCHELALNAELNLRAVYEYESSKLSLQKYTKKRTEKAITIAFQLYSLSGEKKYINRAFQLAENSRSVLLLEGIVNNYVSKQLLKEDSLFYKQQSLVRKKQNLAGELIAENDSLIIQNLQQQFEITNTKLKQVNQLIESKHPKYRTVINQTKKQISINRLGEILRQNETLIEYFQTNSLLYVFKIEKNKTPEFYKLKPDLQQLDELLAALRSDEVSAKNYATNAFNVYQNIFAPLKIASKQNIIIVPDGKLNFLPFEALVTQASAQGSNKFSEQQYLIKNHQISYQYSATIFNLLLNQVNEAQHNKVLAIAPVFEETAHNLKYSEEEVSAIAKLFSVKSLTKNLAHKTNILPKLNLHKVLHFCTHASGGGDSINKKAYIVLYNDTLFLEELYQQKINANLTVLSACETNVGKYERGEGVMSLSRAFAYAGCPSLVSTLWQVNEKSTKEIIVEFYKNLKQGNAKDEALQKAKLHYLKNSEDANPYYWASLVAIGNTQPLQTKSYSKLLWLMLPVGLGVLMLLGKTKPHSTVK